MKKRLLVCLLLAVALTVCTAVAMAEECDLKYGDQVCVSHSYSFLRTEETHQYVKTHQFKSGMTYVTHEETEAHSFGEFYKQDDQSHVRVCSVCGWSNSQGHAFKADSISAGTCVEPAVIQYRCLACPYYYSITDESTLGVKHTCHMIDMEAPTCQKDGWTKLKCDYCEYTTTETTQIGHQFIPVAVKDQPYPCQDGVSYNKCCWCDARSNEKVIAATTSCVASDEYTENPATCFNDGSRKYMCKYGCGTVVKTEVLPKRTHVMTSKVYTAATCGAKGSTMHYCSQTGCTYWYVEEDIPATGKHTFGAWQTETAATCSKAGLEKHSCSVCGATETQSIAATNEHLWSEWKTIIEPTATTDGEAERVCTTCGAEQTKVLKSTGNGSDDDDDDDDDDDSDDDYPIPAPPIDPNHTHVPVTKKGFPATCETWGREDGTGCAICGKFISGNWIAPLGHTPVTVPGYPATETEKGLSDGIKCAVCGKMLLGQYPVDINGTYYDPENPDQPIDPPVYPPVEIEGELEPGHPNFDLDKYLDEYYEHVENGDEIRPTIDSDKCIIGTTVKLEGDNITVLIKGAEDYAICPIDKYPMSQWIDLGNGTHKRICTCIDCDYYEIAACTYFTIVVDEAEYKICPICGHFTEKSYEWIKGVKVGGVGDMNELIARDITAPFGTAAVQVKDMSAEPTVITSSFTAVKSTKGVLNSWTNEETLYIPMENPGDVTLAQMNMDGEFAAVPFAWENGYVIFNADEHGLYLFVK